MIYKEHTLLNLKHIFTPLETIAPPRTSVHTIEDFLERAKTQHLNNHVFANVHGSERMNKLFFDLDGDFHRVEKDGFKLQNRLLNNGFREEDILKIWTTKKGLHIYAKMQEINGLYNPDLRNETKSKLKVFTGKLTEGLKTVDSTVMADLNRVARVAGIERFDNGLTPVVISPDHTIKDWINRHGSRWISIINRGSEIIKSWGAVREGFVNLDDLVSEDDFEVYKARFMSGTPLKDHALANFEVSNFSPTTLPRTEILHALKPILQPILKANYEEFISYNPSHQNRIICVYLLLEAGYSPDLIAKYISYLNWENYDPIKTRNNILHLLNSKKMRS